MPGQGVRIIGGEWRGRRIAVPPGMHVRPTADRNRETLFNWLAPLIEGAHCVDLFAGSGSLGIEALSRGAREVDFVESNLRVALNLQRNIDLLEAGERAHIHRAEAAAWIQRCTDTAWDVVFIDPPFRRDLLLPVLGQLAGHLADPHRVYIEHESNAPPALPQGWQVLRERRAGQVTYKLLQFDQNASL